MGLFEKLMERMVRYYATERGGGIGWRRWQAMDSKSCAAPLGGEKTGRSPTDRGKLRAKVNLLVDKRGAPISVVLTGANRHDKVSAIDLIVSILTKRPAHKEQHLCADKAYDATDVKGDSSPPKVIPLTSRSIPGEPRRAAPSRVANPRKEMSLPRSFIQRGDG